MKILLSIFVLSCTFALGQASPRNQADLPGQSEALVRAFYRVVVSHPRSGLPKTKSIGLISPYFSNALLQRITSARGCENDWYEHHRQADIKPPFPWLEDGLFSGANERAGPSAFQIERSASENDGSFRVYVRLTAAYPPAPTSAWQVAVVVVRENGHVAVDDVIYLKDKDLNTESQLSELLKRGCAGSHWVGYGPGK
jgi:hypothetical protein